MKSKCPAARLVVTIQGAEQGSFKEQQKPNQEDSLGK
jgi:hypothetical protein